MTRKQFWLLVTPSVIVMFGFMLVPLYRTLRWSLQKVTYGEPGVEVGSGELRRGAVRSPARQGVLFTVGLTAVVTAFCVVLGYVLAVREPPGQDAAARLGIMLMAYVPRSCRRDVASPGSSTPTSVAWSTTSTPLPADPGAAVVHPDWPNRVVVTSTSSGSCFRSRC